MDYNVSRQLDTLKSCILEKDNIAILDKEYKVSLKYPSLNYNILEQTAI